MGGWNEWERNTKKKLSTKVQLGLGLGWSSGKVARELLDWLLMSCCRLKIL
jgi:hypothetical protein